MLDINNSVLTRENQTYHLFHDIYVLLDAGDRRVLEQFGLSGAQFRVLTLLGAQPDWRLIDLSEALLVARSTITRVIDGLEREGLVGRVKDAHDRRAYRLRLTDSGRERLRQAHIAHERSLVERFVRLEDGDQRDLTGFLENLRQGLLNDLYENED